MARAFDCSTRTIRRYQQRFADGGLAALGRKRGYPLGRTRLPVSRRKRIERLKAQGCSGREIASALGVTARAVRKVLRRLGLNSEPSPQGELPLDLCPVGDPKLSGLCMGASDSISPAPNPKPTLTGRASPKAGDISASGTGPPGGDPTLSAFHHDETLSATPVGRSEAGLPSTTSPRGGNPKPSAFLSRDTDPADRHGDRLLASLRLLEDAPPLFGCGHGHPTRRCLACRASFGAQRGASMRPEGLWQHWARFLWPADQLADAAAHGSVADQAPRRAQGVFARGFGTRAGGGTAPRRSRPCGGN